MEGGFAGVDVFFVLSGFLITYQLLLEHRRTGGISLRRFFVRRVARLQPALWALLGGYLMAGAVGWLPGAGVDVLRDVGMVALAMSNWARAFEWFAPDYLGHTWSLGIEEQFYLVWAVLLAWLVRRAPAPTWWVGIGAGVGLLLSAACMYALVVAGSSLSRLYNGLDTRAMGLLAGAALACVHLQGQGRASDGRAADVPAGRQRAAEWLAWLGLLGLLWAFYGLRWKAAGMYPWGFLVLNALSALLIWALVVTPRGFVGRGLASAPMVWLGRLSYALYLWHYPLIRMLESKASVWGVSETWAAWGALGLSLVMAQLSYVGVETPIRRYVKMRLSARSV